MVASERFILFHILAMMSIVPLLEFLDVWQVLNMSMFDINNNSIINDVTNLTILFFFLLFFSHFQDFDFDLIATNVHGEDIMVDEKETFLVSIEQHIRSKQSSHVDVHTERCMKRSLSVSVVSDVISKKFRHSDATNDFISIYLQTDNQCFQFVMTVFVRHYTKTTTNTISFENVRTLTVLKHHMYIVKQEQELWQFYLKLGTDQMETLPASRINIKDRCFWPSIIRSKNSSRIQALSSNDEQRFYETFVIDHLQELDQLITKHRHDYNMMKSDLKNDFAMEIEQILDAYVQYFGIKPLQLKLNYESYLLDCKYQLCAPTEYQGMKLNLLISFGFFHFLRF